MPIQGQQAHSSKIFGVGAQNDQLDAHMPSLVHAWWRPLVYTLALLPVGLFLLQLVMANYLDRIGIHHSYITKWFAGPRTLYHYSLQAHSNDWPMWPVYLYWSGVVAFVASALSFIFG